MRRNILIFSILLAAVVLLFACRPVATPPPAPKEVEVTKVIEVTKVVPVEVTRIVEVTKEVPVEVTRIVEVQQVVAEATPTAVPPKISDAAKACVECHEKETPKMVEQWKKSTHASLGVDCVACHRAAEDDWDATDHYGSVIATHPTAGDCAICHRNEYEQNLRSKHAIAVIWMIKSADRNVFEETLMTKHGCQECHNIGHYWPDGSVGECDACHAKHTFDLAVARSPETCGECHLGPDHPDIEIYMQSKHGNIYAVHSHEWDMAYKPDASLVPFDAPTCATCHMDGAPGLEPTHDVGARLSWETQSPYSIRTQWGQDETGLTWQDKRAAMQTVCSQCHAKPFIDRYLLEADLGTLQYNELFKISQAWLTKMKEAGIIRTPGFKWTAPDGTEINISPFGLFGYDDRPEVWNYHNWHHEGRRYRHGLFMGGSDFVQWHGIWDLQHNLTYMIQYAADRGLKEAQEWLASPDVEKFWMYQYYDVPGSAWGIDTLAFRDKDPLVPIRMNRIGREEYWKGVYANVEAAYNHGLLTDDEWELWKSLYENRDKEDGIIYDLPEMHSTYM
ncbi:MAG TPA: hypothetical protein EYH31_08985, partial [Anaerolineae bacterium]|nr:hypothetical protein [Anaerolineae bacterium]